ncbi:hypothetical protein HPHPH36_0983 [Helicobacter pylori Hp H-36]|nr:hypothetical protein HPHPH36_0983 [Helicobacter pylori Hp H-36]
MNFLLPNKGAFKTTDNTILGASFEMTPPFSSAYGYERMVR